METYPNDHLETAESAADVTETAIPVISEELQTGVHIRQTGGVRIHKTVEEHEEVVDMPLIRDEVDVRRVMKNEIVPGPLEIRQEGDTTVVPVVKEVLKIERQWVLTEELHITKRRIEERSEQHVILQREGVEVQRMDAEGRDIGSARVSDATAEMPATETTQPTRSTFRRNRTAPPLRQNKIVK